MINSTAFDYVNVLTKAADASYQREAILANNKIGRASCRERV